MGNQETILGSCLAIIVFVPRLHLSAICHARLPKGKCDVTQKSGFCYVDSSLDYMINKLLSMGAKKNEFIVKAFGGAQVVFPHLTFKNKRVTIGEQNIDAIYSQLKDHELTLSSYEFGGKSGRKLIYNTHNNEVLIKPLTKQVITKNETNLLLKNFIFNR